LQDPQGHELAEIVHKFEHRMHLAAIPAADEALKLHEWWATKLWGGGEQFSRLRDSGETPITGL
jgi:hypothetical protein